MAKGKPKNLPASVRDRLLRLAQERGEDFNFVLARYAIERLMYRLSRSEHGRLFVLKGATLFHLWGVAAHRPTKDVDFLARGDNTPEHWIGVFRSVVETDVEPDGLAYDASSIKAEPISVEAEYRGVRVTMTANLGVARIPVQADIGFGDAVVPKPKVETLPVLLDQPAPRMKTYPREAVVAEKFHAMVLLGSLNTRLKDYFDLWLMARHFEFDGVLLAQAVAATFARRETPVPKELPAGLSRSFSEDGPKRQQWASFVERVAEEHRNVSLGEVAELLERFLMPVCLATSGMGIGRWSPDGGWAAFPDASG